MAGSEYPSLIKEELAKNETLWISKLARKLGVTEGTIRYHLRKGVAGVATKTEGKNKILVLKAKK